MASTYIHVGDVKEIPNDAPPALRFVQSYIPALDGSSHEVRNRHFSPDATIQTHPDKPLPFAGMAKMFDMRDRMTSKFWHVVNRVWIVTESEEKVTVLMDWESTTVFPDHEDKPAFVPEFSILKLARADEGKGVHGLWVESIENWMDTSPVKEVRQEIIANAAPK